LRALAPAADDDLFSYDVVFFFFRFPQGALAAAPGVRGEALRALAGLLGDAAGELAPLSEDDAHAVAVAARMEGVAPEWGAACAAHRATQADIVAAWAAAAAAWAAAAAAAQPAKRGGGGGGGAKRGRGGGARGAEDA
jgi:hypothetical protein